MARKKVKLAWIANDATRRATLKKRRKGLVKKVQELSILCGVDACVVVYAPQEQEPVAWPSPAEAARMMARFKNLPEIERNRKMVNQETFLRQRIAKLQEQLRRQQRENREIEVTALLFEGLRGRSLHDLSIEDATALAWMVDNKLRSIYEKRDELAKQMSSSSSPPPLHAANLASASAYPPSLDMLSLPTTPPPLPPPQPTMNLLHSGHGHGEAGHSSMVVHKPSWFVDMMSPWPSQAAVEEPVHVFADQTMNPWPDSFFH